MNIYIFALATMLLGAISGRVQDDEDHFGYGCAVAVIVVVLRGLFEVYKIKSGV